MRLATFLAGVLTAASFTALYASAQETTPCVAPDTAPATTEEAPSIPVETTAEQLPVTSVEPTPISSPTVLVLNELLPNPVGDDALEFIEIANTGSADVALAGWSIIDGNGKRFTFGDEVVAPESVKYMLYGETKLRLANTAGHAELISPDGTVVDVISYISPVPEGSSYARFGDTWRWVKRPSPGSENEPDAEAVSVPIAQETTSTAVIVTSATVANASTPFADARVAFSTIQPNPEGSDEHEWFEIHNDGVTLPLDGWRVADSSGSTFTITGVTLDAGATRRFEKPTFSFALNNDADSLRLLDPTGAERDFVAYEDAAAGATYLRGLDGWRWNTATAEVIETETAFTSATQTAEDTDSADGAPDTVPAEDTPIGAMDGVDDGVEVSVRGIVTLEPGVVGKTIFAIQSVDEDAGIYIRAYGRDPLPQLAAGDLVHIDGTVRKNGGLRLNTNAASTSVVGRANVRDAERLVADISTEDDAVHVLLSGIVASRGKRSITISDEAGTNEVITRFMRGEAPVANAGDSVRLAGVVRAKGDAIEIIVTDADATTITPLASNNADTPTTEQQTVPKSAPRPALAIDLPTTTAVGTGATLTIFALIGGGYALWRKSRAGQWEEEVLVDR